MRFKISITRDAAALLGLGQHLAHALAAEIGGHRHAGERNAIDFLFLEDVDGAPERGQLLFNRLDAVALQIQACGDEDHALGRDVVELVGIHVGLQMRDDVAELVPRMNDGHRKSPDY